MIQEEVNIQKITLSAPERRFFQHKRCFKSCIKMFDEPNLDENQKVCVRNCLLKHRDAQKFIGDKIHRAMQTLIRSDLSLMASYQDQQNKKEQN